MEQLVQMNTEFAYCGDDRMIRHLRMWIITQRQVIESLQVEYNLMSLQRMQNDIHKGILHLSISWTIIVKELYLSYTSLNQFYIYTYVCSYYICMYVCIPAIVHVFYTH
jgi:hypothetical protein